MGRRKVHTGIWLGNLNGRSPFVPFDHLQESGYGHYATTNFKGNNFLQPIITIWWLCESLLYAWF